MLQVEENRKSSCIMQFLAILFLPLLFLTGLGLGYAEIIPLKVELHTLVIVAFIFVVFSSFVKHNANYAACHMRGNFHYMEEELRTALRENALTIMNKTKSTLNINDFIVAFYKEMLNDNFARVAPSVFPMLGILGTFIAIAISMPDFTVQDLTALDQEISILLSGIGTAFYASIYGIFLSLLWTYFEKRGNAKVDKNIFDLEKLYEGRVWKESELIKHRHMQSELKDQALIRTLHETFNMNFIKDLNEQYLKNFTKVLEESTKGFTEVTTHMLYAVDHLNKTLEKIHIIDENVTAEFTMKENIEAFNESAQILQKSLERFDGTVDHTFEKIDTEMGKAIEKLSDFGRVISEQNQRILKNLPIDDKE
ncbi:MotA/TolQ/ExbB proton channel family protein [Sulfurovum sp.]|uniref:MotA/TolQ/ExbB proton channel family protein n=1 Tax=Sulfurovum sp. TaxID=1969726 RepID=UPI002A365B6B|nr:MotA/TolQ/ExbB proton channel family protein [Sulfurovum sp.]MDY0403647.1 MotA/TolQ/ExbB proton channel family protein [Sulfurovum sp.]